MDKKKSALLIGASGLVGRHCLSYLLEDDYYSSVMIFVRNEIKIIHEKLTEYIIDFNRLASYSKLVKCDDVFCCIGTTMKKAGSKAEFYKVDYTYPYETAKLSLNAGATGFYIVTAIGASPSSLIFYNKTKGQIESALKELPFQNVGVFRPSMLTGKRDETRVGEELGKTIMNVFNFTMQGPLKKYRTIDAKKVAYSMVKIAKENRKGFNVFESDEMHFIYDKDHEV